MTFGPSGSAAIAAILFVVAPLAGACGGVTEPGSGTAYSLETVDGARLPVGDKSNPGSVISSGTIDFVGSDSAEVRETSQGNGSVISLDRVHVDRNGATLIFRSYAVDISPDTAALDGNQITVRHHVPSLSGPVVEIRVYDAR